MTLPRLSLCTALVLSALSTLNAQSVATAPVGAVAISVNAGSDQKVGIPVLRSSLFVGAVQSISTGVITPTGTLSELGAEAKFIKFTSGTLVGQWFTITASTSSTVSVAEDLAAMGVVASDKFEIRPFWTLATLLPTGGGVPVSTDVFNPVGLVLLNNPEAVGINIASSGFYFYHDGSSGFLSAGWYNLDDYSSADTTVVSPEVSLTYRNGTNAVATVLNVGEVPTSPIATSIVARVGGDQDNLVFNPYPASITLANAGLVASNAVKSSADIFNPGDQVLFFGTSSTGLNPSASQFYFYHDGSSGILPAGWYKNDGSYESANNDAIAHGAAIVIRKASGSASITEWTPNLPYTL